MVFCHVGWAVSLRSCCSLLNEAVISFAVQAKAKASPSYVGGAKDKQQVAPETFKLSKKLSLTFFNTAKGLSGAYFISTSQHGSPTPNSWVTSLRGRIIRSVNLGAAIYKVLRAKQGGVAGAVLLRAYFLRKPFLTEFRGEARES